MTKSNFGAGCDIPILEKPQHRHEIDQVSTIAALLNGAYDGEVTVGELLTHGDFGLGTFDHLDGEMVVLDGEVFQIFADGRVRRPPPSLTTPFAAVTFFEQVASRALLAGLSFDDFTVDEDAHIPTPNIFYAIRIDGHFRSISARSVPRQSKPYPPLAEVAAQQSVFGFEDISGTILGFRCPSYVSGINVPGYHLHFISDDRTKGGHVLDFVAEQTTAAIDSTDAFSMMLPPASVFYEDHVSGSDDIALDAIERGQAHHAHIVLAR